MNHGDAEPLPERLRGHAAEADLTEELDALHGVGWDGDLEELRDDRHRLEGFER